MFAPGADNTNTDFLGGAQPQQQQQAAAAAPAAAAASSTAGNMIDNNPSDPNAYSLSIAPSENYAPGKATGTFGITINVPEATAPVPVDVCLVIDQSESMKYDIQYQDPHDEKKMITQQGFSRLCLVKHACKTIISTLGDNDRIAVVSFNDQSEKILELTKCDAAGRQKAITALDKIKPEYQTELTCGAKAAFDILREQKEKDQRSGDASVRNRNATVVLLTDGEPTEELRPKEGEAAVISSYFEQHADFKCSLHEFAFTYANSSDVMLSMVQAGGGIYAFLPDALQVGPNFVACVANARSTVGYAKLHITASGGASLPTSALVDTTIPVKTTSWGSVVKLGPLTSGQSRDVAINVHGLDRAGQSSSCLDVTLELVSPAGVVTKVKASGSLAVPPTPASISALGRGVVCNTLSKVIASCDQDKGKHMQQGQQMMRDLVANLQTLGSGDQTATMGAPSAPPPVITALLADVSGRATKSVSTTERWNRWGRHYLRALYRSHQFQLCSNNLDEGLQTYGHTLFKKLFEDGGNIFMSLPMPAEATQHPPSPKKKQQPAHNTSKAAAAQSQKQQQQAPRPKTPEQSMGRQESSNDYWGGGCFAGSCTVETADDNAAKLVSDVRRGDLLRMADGSFRTVDVVVELQHERRDLITLPESGLTITRNHPVRVGASSWQRPRNVAGAVDKVSAPGVFNFVFDKKPTCGLLVNGVECVTYHHDVEELQHAFYSSPAIVNTLRVMSGYDAGHVTVHAPTIKPPNF